MIMHTVIKIRYISEGYLPNIPYHLISDDEMFDAFIFNDINYFDYTYPLEDATILDIYTGLKRGIIDEISRYKKDNTYVIPAWVYSYMLGAVIGPNSPVKDRHSLLVGLGLDNISDSFNIDVYRTIYKISNKQIHIDSVTGVLRPPTIFGETSILKYLRLRQSKC